MHSFFVWYYELYPFYIGFLMYKHQYVYHKSANISLLGGQCPNINTKNLEPVPYMSQKYTKQQETRTCVVSEGDGPVQPGHEHSPGNQCYRWSLHPRNGQIQHCYYRRIEMTLRQSGGVLPSIPGDPGGSDPEVWTQSCQLSDGDGGGLMVHHWMLPYPWRRLVHC